MGLEALSSSQKQSLSGTNRTNASSLQELSRQLTRLQNIVNAIPKNLLATTTATGFGLSSGWNTVASVSLTVPANSNRAIMTATGSGLLVTTTTTGLVTSKSRVVISGNVQAEGPNPWYPGNSDFRAIMVPRGALSLSVTPGATITAEFQVNPDAASSFPPNPATYAVLSLRGSFTG